MHGPSSERRAARSAIGRVTTAGLDPQRRDVSRPPRSLHRGAPSRATTIDEGCATPHF
jgi:hypothetical protein